MASSGVLCWGHNNFTAGLLGVGSTEEIVTTPTAVRRLGDVTDLAVAKTHACALTPGGALACWGSAEGGRLGSQREPSKTAVELVADVDAFAAEPSVAPTFAPAAGGARASTPSFAMGDRHVCGVVEGGRVLCFGDGQSGQLGTGSTESTRTAAPRPVVGITDAIQVAAGIDRACALRANGEVACWGRLARDRSSSLPVPIAGVDGAVEIAVGGSARGMHLCARRADGHVACLGPGESAPVEISGLDDAAQIAVGLDAACVRRATGAVSCWGSAAEGQLGHGRAQAAAAPVEVAGLAGVTDLTAGEYGFCAAYGRGLVACWGSNDHGQIGDGRRGGDADARSPVTVRGLRDVVRVDLGGGTACAVTAGGSARCWGANRFGQTGRAPGRADVPRPAEAVRPRDPEVVAFGPYAAMSCGTNLCCGLHRDGHVSCQGSGSFFGSTEIRVVDPKAIAGVEYLSPSPRR
jgi:alpha-tubulin suppressor-like RCC1 family protein